MMKFIKRIMNNIKMELSFTKAANTKDTLPNATADMVNKEGFIVIHNHNAVRRARCLFARIMQTQFKQLPEPTPVVVVDDDFYKLSKDSQRVVIEQALAHFTLHGCENDDPNVDIMAEDSLRKDREADAEVFHVLYERVVIEQALAHFTLHGCENDDPNVDIMAEDSLRKDREADAEVFHVLYEDDNTVLKAFDEMKKIINSHKYSKYIDLRIKYFNNYVKVNRRNKVSVREIIWALEQKYNRPFIISGNDIVAK